MNSKSYASYEKLVNLGVTEHKDAEIIQFHPDVNASGMPALDQMTQDELRSQLIAAVEQHAALDKRLTKLLEMSHLNIAIDMIENARLKKNKLLLKDRMQSIKAKLLPDIIA